MASRIHTSLDILSSYSCARIVERTNIYSRWIKQLKFYKMVLHEVCEKFNGAEKFIKEKIGEIC